MATRTARLIGVLLTLTLASCGPDSTETGTTREPDAARFAVYLASGSPGEVIRDFVFEQIRDPGRRIAVMAYDQADQAVEVIAIPGASRAEVLDQLGALFRDLDVECVAEVPGPQTGKVPPREELPDGACERLD